MVSIDQKSEYVCSVFCSGNKASASLSFRLKALEENPLVSSFRLLAKFNYLQLQADVPISLLTLSQRPPLVVRSFCSLQMGHCISELTMAIEILLMHGNFLTFFSCCKGFKRLFINLETKEIMYHEFNLKNNREFQCS